MAYRALGHRFAVHCDDLVLVDRVRHLFASLVDPSDEPREAVALAASNGAASGLVDLMSRVNLAAIDAAAGNLLLHAGAVADDDGSVAVVSGPSGSGKTTLTICLTETGLSYVTDEAVCLDPMSLRITPFRKPAVVKPGSQPVLEHLRPSPSCLPEGTWLVPPSDFDRAREPQRPLLPALLVFPTFVAGQDCSVEALEEAEAAYLLGAESSRLKDVRGGALPALARLARRAPAFRVVHGDAREAAAAVHRLLGAA